MTETQRKRGRPKGSKNKPSPEPKRRKRLAGVSSATRRAMDQAQADSNSGVNVDAFERCAAIFFRNEDVLDTFRGEYMARCKGPREAQAAAIDRAKDEGCPTAVTRLKLKLMAKDRAKEKLRSAAEPDTLAMVRQIETAKRQLGDLVDTPLGEAHIESIEKRGAEAVASIAEGGNLRQAYEEAHYPIGGA